ncbi:MarR family transcriptional regulator [Kineococcus sp. NPDC059986]|jgi:DNA-binding MarR family transcriptional regulator|uniref:MarR family winged helix-turn-helix transcriptional regulator n=1 Tax=Kineococcus sp. NPDC059986 TaxID=3155538 RepID=UPI00345094E7
MTTAPHDDWWRTVSTSALLRAGFRSYGDVVRSALAAAGFDDLPRNGAYVLGATAKGSLTIQQLPSALGVTKQAFSQLVDALVLRGYVERAPDPQDRRRVLLTLTDRGAQVADLVETCGRRTDAALVEVVGGQEALDTARRVLGAMTTLPADLATT